MEKWIVHKFGGSSVADAACMRRVADIVEASANPREAVVLSACRGVTDSLLGLIRLAEQPDGNFLAALRTLEKRHQALAAELLPPEMGDIFCSNLAADVRDIAGMLQTVRLIRSAPYSVRDLVSGYGEIWSTSLFAPLLRARGRIRCDVKWIDARQVVIVEWGPLGPAVQWAQSEKNLQRLVSGDFTGRLVVTGFVATTVGGTQTTLGRNGSDFSGSIFGALLNAAEIHIWTDVDGVLSADPRLVPNAEVIDQLSYNEAMELAYFGAKVIHPQTMEPAVARDIPIYIRNTFAPQKRGTLICAHPSSALIVKGITTIDPVALVNVEGAGMIGVPGTAHRLFGALRDAGISVILISQGSSEHSICFAIPEDQSRRAEDAVRRAFDTELRDGQIQSVDVDHGLSILAVVGDGMAGAPRSRGPGVQVPGPGRDQRARHRAGRVRAQHLGRRRRQDGREGAARRACGLLPFGQHAVDRPDRPGNRRPGPAGADPLAAAAPALAERGFPGARHRDLHAHAAGRAFDRPRRLARQAGVVRRAAGPREIRAARPGRLHSAHGDRRLHGQCGRRVELPFLARTRNPRRDPEQEGQQRPAAGLPGAAGSAARLRHPLSLRGNRRCGPAGDTDAARPAGDRRRHHQHRGNFLRNPRVPVQRVRRQRDILLDRQGRPAEGLHRAGSARRPVRHGRGAQADHPGARDGPDPRDDRRAGRGTRAGRAAGVQRRGVHAAPAGIRQRHGGHAGAVGRRGQGAALRGPCRCNGRRHRRPGTPAGQPCIRATSR